MISILYHGYFRLGAGAGQEQDIFIVFIVNYNI